MRRLVALVATVSMAAGLGGSACSLGDDESGGLATDAASATEPVGATTSGSTTSAMSTTEPPDRIDAAGLCDVAVLQQAGPIADAELTEISGVVASGDLPGVLWVHNDSGHPNEVWAIDSEGEVLGRFTVAGATSVDWEDIGLGAGPTADRSYLFVGDIGDNSFTPVIGTGLDPRSKTKPAVIYRVPEPDVPGDDPGNDPGVDPSAETSAEVTPEAGSSTEATSEGASETEPAAETEPAVAFPVAYADGPRDAEALLADPVTGDVFVVSKQWDRSPTGLYRLPAAIVEAGAAPAGITTMERVADVAGPDGAPGAGPGLITGADISVDGTLVALRTYGSVILWDRDLDQSLAETLVEPPICTRKVEEPQGEAVTFGSDSQSMVTISEGNDVPLNWLIGPAD